MLASRSGGEKGMRKALCLIQTLILAACSVGAQEAPAIPDLSPLSLDDFSSAVRGQIQEAYADARAHPGDDTAYGRLGMILQTYGLLQEAAVCYRRARWLAPSAFRWAYYLAIVESANGHCDAAAATLRRAPRVAPDYVPAKLRLATCLLASADWSGSEELYRSIVKQHPDNADAYYGLGRVRAARRDLTGAAEAYSKACALFPDFGAAHYALALIYRTLGQDGKAKEQLHLFEKSKDEAPASNDPLLKEVRALNLIELYGRLSQFQKAEEHYRAATHLEPGSVESYYNYGVLLVSVQKYEQAESAFRKTIEIDPFHAAAHNNLGYLLERQGKLLEAAAEYRTAIENKPSDRQAHFNLGRVLVNQHEYREGIQELEKTIEPEDENTPRYIYALGAAFARSGDRQNALRYIRQARDGAVARGQSGLVDSIERDLRILETPPGTPQ